jgi:hypothetical protein
VPGSGTGVTVTKKVVGVFVLRFSCAADAINEQRLVSEICLYTYVSISATGRSMMMAGDLVSFKIQILYLWRCTYQSRPKYYLQNFGWIPIIDLHAEKV